MFGNIQKRIQNKRLNKLATMKAKTRSLRERKVQYNAEAKIEREYKQEKKAAFNRSTLGKLKSFAKKEITAKKKRNRSSGLFAEEAQSSVRRAKRKSSNDILDDYDNEDTFKKWGL